MSAHLRKKAFWTLIAASIGASAAPSSAQKLVEAARVSLTPPVSFGFTPAGPAILAAPALSAATRPSLGPIEALAMPSAAEQAAEPARAKTSSSGKAAASNSPSSLSRTATASKMRSSRSFAQAAAASLSPEEAMDGRKTAPGLHPERTAMARSRPSVPTRLVKPLLKGKILDYGAGRGQDTLSLKAAGLKVQAYDPFYFPNKPAKTGSFDWVMLNYVLNVIRSPAERAEVLRDIAGLLKHGGRLLVSVRDDVDSSRGKGWTRAGDGWITPRQTFQHGYTRAELESSLEKAGFKVVKALDPLILVAEKGAPDKTKNSFGKQTAQAVYYHRSLENQAPTRLRSLVDRAKKRLPKKARWNLIKVDNHGDAVSFLWYPDFDSDPHPALSYVYRVDLKTGKTSVRDHSSRANPFILHRKDAMVGSDYPLYARLRALTAKEEAAGLLSRNDIGTRRGWEAALKSAKGAR